MAERWTIRAEEGTRCDSSQPALELSAFDRARPQPSAAAAIFGQTDQVRGFHPDGKGVQENGRWIVTRARSFDVLRDARFGQIAALGTLFLVGKLALGFPVPWSHAGLLLATTLLTQALCTWCFGPRLHGPRLLGPRLLGPRTSAAGRIRFDPLSATISALSLCLLLRSNEPWVLALAAFCAIASKFVLRWGGKHIFNPAAFGIAVAVLLTDRAWISPGQWGSGASLMLLIAGFGCLVVYRAMRWDVTVGFLAAYAAVLFARSAWLGEPMAIPLHRLDNGALLVFAFFMITDPKTTPDSRLGRLVHVLAIALGAGFVHFVLFRSSGVVWALLALAPLVPLIDRLLPGERYRWAVFGAHHKRAPVSRSNPVFLEEAMNNPTAAVSSLRSDSPLHGHAFFRRHGAGSPWWIPARSLARVAPRAPRLSILAVLAVALALLGVARADAFCGFYVAKADTKLFNRASQVVLVRDGDRTVLTMANDYRGEAAEFALVVPVPTVLQRDQIHVAEQALIDHLDAYTSPRLVEYHDQDPCSILERRAMSAQAPALPESAGGALGDADLGVRIEAKYTVGEYDILILSAEQSSGLETWLVRNGYRIPSGAAAVLDSYLKQGMRFFVAKVNLDEKDRLGVANLRPLQIAFEHPRFMLPIRLGTVNADGPQELFVYTLTREGRVETTNYRTVKLPSDVEIPTFVGDEFPDFYRSLFDRAALNERQRAVFLEYAWDMSWCDPCAADPLSATQLRELGVFWVDRAERPGGALDVFVTRLHLRYDGVSFPEDLAFQQTADRSNFQGRYVMRHPWRGRPRCAAGERYLADLPARFEREAQTLARLTGWELVTIRERMGLDAAPLEERSWWQRLWPGAR
jgi:hypothetical protein